MRKEIITKIAVVLVLAFCVVYVGSIYAEIIKTKDGEEGTKRRRSKKSPPLSKADPKTEEMVVD